MQITRISVYQADLPVRGGGFRQSSGRIWRVLDTSVVRMETDAGVTGWGETCPFGANYVPAFAEGARAGMEFLAAAAYREGPVRRRRDQTCSWTRRCTAFRLPRPGWTTRAGIFWASRPECLCTCCLAAG